MSSCRLLVDLLSCGLSRAFQQSDLPFVIRVVLEQSTDQSPDGEAGAERRIALIPDPPKEIIRLEQIHRALHVLLSGGEILKRRAPSGFPST
jgi:hypothetical protein